MAEHTPNPYLVIAMELLFWAVALAALAFWVGALVWPGGLRPLMAALGPGAVSIFVVLHIPCTIIGVLLWQWRRHGMSARRRVMLEGATLYFGLAVVFGIFMNYLAASVLDRLM